MNAGKRAYRLYLHNESEPKLPRTTEWRLKKRRNDSNYCKTDVDDTPHTTGSAESDIINDYDNDHSLPHDSYNSGQQNTGTASNSAMSHFDTSDNEDQNIAFLLNHSTFINTFDENEEEPENENSLNSDCSDSSVEDSEEESVNEHELFENTPDDEPLYSNAPLSVSESLMLILTYAIRHCLSFAALNDLLKLVSAICPQPNNVKTSVRQVWAYFGNMNSEKVLHFYCRNCYKYLGSRIQPQEGTRCGGCGKQLTEKEPYFLHISFIQQIRNLFMKEDFVQNLSYRFQREQTTDIRDVYDGLKYKQLFEDGGFLSDPYNISLQMNTDGVAIFKSSNVSVWPIYMTVNELPPKARFSRDMRIFAGLWFGSAKPNMTTFLRPLADELFEAYSGITLTINNQIVTVRSILLTACLDAPARCMFQSFTQFNGENGCGYCTEKGKVVTSGKGHARIYPFNREHESKLGHDSLRTHEQTKINAVLAQNGKKAVQGVKGISWGLILPHFDIITGVPIDYMHAVLLGVVKLLITFWFNKSFSKYPWSCVKTIKECDRRRSIIEPPDFVKRIPRSIELYGSKYKAAEYRTWLLYYLYPVMKGILPDIYLHHALLLVNGIYLLLKSNIKLNDVQKSRSLLQHFCLRMPSIYLENKSTYNVHQLLHLPSCVENLGPLWSFSCFFYEDLNGDLRKLFHGSQAFEMQISNATYWLQQVTTFESKIKSEKALEVFLRMKNVRGKGPRPVLHISDFVKFVGRPFTLRLATQSEKDAVYAYSGENIEHIEIYQRLIVKNILYHTAKYKRALKRNSYTVLLSENEGNAIAFVQYAFSYPVFCGHLDCRVQKKCDITSREYGVMVWICKNHPFLQPTSHSLVGPIATMDYAIPVKPAKTVNFCKAVKPVDIIEKLVYAEVNGEGYAFRPPNDIEKE